MPQKQIWSGSLVHFKAMMSPSESERVPLKSATSEVMFPLWYEQTSLPNRPTFPRHNFPLWSLAKLPQRMGAVFPVPDIATAITGAHHKGRTIFPHWLKTPHGTHTPKGSTTLWWMEASLSPSALPNRGLVDSGDLEKESQSTLARLHAWELAHLTTRTGRWCTYIMWKDSIQR